MYKFNLWSYEELPYYFLYVNLRYRTKPKARFQRQHTAHIYMSSGQLLIQSSGIYKCLEVTMKRCWKDFIIYNLLPHGLKSRPIIIMSCSSSVYYQKFCLKMKTIQLISNQVLIAVKPLLTIYLEVQSLYYIQKR